MLLLKPVISINPVDELKRVGELIDVNSVPY